MVLDVIKVTKQYEGHVAVEDLSLQVREGIIFGLLGPNGAGKTTLIRMITGITRPDEGKIHLLDQAITGLLRPEIGYLPEERGLYKKMKVAEQLVYLGMLKGLSRSDSKKSTKYWLEKFRMMDWRHRKIEELSKGMQQKIQFIATILHDPKLIILDEPFSGLDPVNTNLIKEEILAMRNDGKSIIFSTHRMEQVEEVCEEIALISQGRNILNGRVEDIKQAYKSNLFRVDVDDCQDITEIRGLEVVSQNGKSLTIRLADKKGANEALRILLKTGLTITRFEELLPSLNDVFIKAVSK